MPKKRIGADPLDDLIPTHPRRTTVDRIRSASRKKKPESPPEASSAEWEASHTRVTFYCPVSLLGQVEQEIRRSGRSKTRVIVDAIREHLKVK
jgi:hypothetical protein